MTVTYTITAENAGLTIKQLFEKLQYSTEHIKRLKYHTEGITVNGFHKTVRYVLAEGDVLTLTTPAKLYTAQGTLQKATVLYSDEYLYVAEKPYGVFTHADNVHFGNTFADMLANTLENFELHILTRLDYTTSGVVLGAFDELTAERLSVLQQNRAVNKTYYAICTNMPPQNEGEINLPLITRNSTAYVDENGKEAITRYKVVCTTAKGVLVQLTPVTGRTHQLRAHLSAIGSPILGDEKYGGTPSDRVYLHATTLSFTHPVTGKNISVTSPPPFGTDCRMDR